jgi:hypothetical protein
MNFFLKKHLNKIKITYEFIKFIGKIKTYSFLGWNSNFFLEIRNTIVN